MNSLFYLLCGIIFLNGVKTSSENQPFSGVIKYEVLCPGATWRGNFRANDGGGTPVISAPSGWVYTDTIRTKPFVMDINAVINDSRQHIGTSFTVNFYYNGVKVKDVSFTTTKIHYKVSSMNYIIQ